MTDMRWRDPEERMRREDQTWRRAWWAAVVVTAALGAGVGGCAYRDHLITAECQQEHWGDQPAYADCLGDRGITPVDGPWKS